MEYYSFENIRQTESGHYNLFDKTIVYDPTLPYMNIIVEKRFNGRLDLLCKFLHGTDKYVEELMVINNIYNMNSLQSGTKIKYLEDSSNYAVMYKSDEDINDKKDEILGMNKQKSTKKDGNRIGVPPTIMPDGLKQIDINYSKRKISLINKLS